MEATGTSAAAAQEATKERKLLRRMSANNAKLLRHWLAAAHAFSSAQARSTLAEAKSSA